MDLIKNPDSFSIDDRWVKIIEMLKRLDFRLMDEDEDGYLSDENDWNVVDGDLVYVEKVNHRNRIAIILRADGDFEVHVQDNIAMGFIIMPFLWNELRFEWLNHLKHAFTGDGFVQGWGTMNFES